MSLGIWLKLDRPLQGFANPPPASGPLARLLSSNLTPAIANHSLASSPDGACLGTCDQGKAMKVLQSLVLSVLLLLFGREAWSVELHQSPSFDAELRLEAGAIDNVGRIDPGKIMVFVRARERAEDVHVYANLEIPIDGGWLTVGSIVCGVGTLEARQLIVYRGISCNLAPDPMVRPAKSRLWSTISVRFTGGTTGTARIKVRNYPPGMSYRE